MVILHVGDFSLAAREDWVWEHPRKRGRQLPCLNTQHLKGHIPLLPALIVTSRRWSSQDPGISSAATAIRAQARAD